jgi:hypothetical protein
MGDTKKRPSTIRSSGIAEATVVLVGVGTAIWGMVHEDLSLAVQWYLISLSVLAMTAGLLVVATSVLANRGPARLLRGALLLAAGIALESRNGWAVVGLGLVAAAVAVHGCLRPLPGSAERREVA